MPGNLTTQPAPRNSPQARAELTTRLQEFHRRVVEQTSREVMLKVYCHAVCAWAADPNTDLYHVERLFDEIHHASGLESLDDWDAEPA